MASVIIVSGNSPGGGRALRMSVVRGSSMEGLNDTRKPMVPPSHLLVKRNKILTNEVRTDDPRIYLVRSGEDCDTIMPAWRNRAFETYQAYRLLDMNQPALIPRRPGGEDDYISDAPLTNIGSMSAQFVGRAITMRSLIATLYASPALASVQTAQSISSCLRGNPKVCIEPGLFEPLPLITQNPLPNFLSPEEMNASGIEVNTTYQPIMKTPLEKSEAAERTLCDAYVRIGEVGDEIAKLCSSKGKSAVIVCDAIGIDALFRRITRRSDEPGHVDYATQMRKCYPQCCTLTLQWNSKSRLWQYDSDAIPPMTLFHARNNAIVPSFERNDKTAPLLERETLY